MADELSPQLETEYARHDGRSVAFASVGEGTPVLYLTPFYLPLRMQWTLGTSRRFIRKLAETHRVLLIDDGHYLEGRSERDLPVPDDYLSGLVADFIAVFDAAGVDRCHVVASLLSSIPAMAAAARHPDRIASLLLWNGLLSGRSFGADEGALELLRLSTNPNPQVATSSLLGALGIAGDSNVSEESRELVMALRAQPAQQRVAFRGLVASDLSPEADRIESRTLVVAPDRAILPGRGLVEELASAVPGARLIHTGGAAVSPEFDDHTVSLPLVLDWIDPAESKSREARLATLAPAGDGARVATRRHADGLSEREVEVLRLLAAGMRNAEIADRLVIAPGTVARHVSNIFAKTGATNRAEATRYALRHEITE